MEFFPEKSERIADVLDVSFSTEYTMLTKKFWSAVEVMSGFVSAIALVVWVFRVYHAYSRYTNTSPEYNDNPYHFFIHAMMLGFNSFVSAFFPFILILCLYW
jgi:hypothetical protein